MDDDIYERFEISNWDLENEFNPKRYRKRVSKKQQIYGIWASSESEDDDDSKSKSKAPINFVSGGFKDSTENQNEERSDNEQPEVPHSFGVERKQFAEKSVSETAGLRHKNRLNPKDAEFGKWEAHTKGIGAKLLKQMGYQPGKGLGKNLQGIATPIEATKRPGTGSLGFYGPEKKVDDEKLSKIAGKADSKQRKKANAESKHKAQTKYVFKTVDDILAESGVNLNFDESELSKTKVIDMTGPQQRVLSGYHEISKKPSDEEIAKHKEIFVQPDLENNVEMLLKLSEEAIIKSSREMKREKDKIESLEEEQTRLKNVIFEEKRRVANLERVIKSVTEMNDKYSSHGISLEYVLEFCNNLYNDFSVDKNVLSEIISSFLFPLIEKEISSWKVIENPHISFSLFKAVKSLLLKIDENLYETLLWDVWMPVVRRKLIEWNSIRRCDEIIKFLETWKPLLPKWLITNIMEQIIIPRIELEVDAWNPLTDTVPVHSWVHPWLPLVEDASLESVYIPIRHKLSNALTSWHPSDCSAKLILQPWKEVFSAGTWNTFLLQNIVPKLEIAMQTYDINPQAQRLDVWQWVMAWEEMLPSSVICSILEKYFLPKWLQVLYDWLCNNPNFDEVSRWYTGWKSMFSEKLLNSLTVKEAFDRALQMMNCAVSSPIGMAAYNFTPFLSEAPEVPRFSTQPSFVQNHASRMNSNPNFKHLIERKAEEHAILFMPIANKYQESKQVYKFGNLTIYINQQVIFVYKDGQWIPISLQALIDSALESNV
ncbi:tuftelin-interacting protein 11-like protein [Dinothrombium tinctorium]|uniref:Tuftelin-interacting protein 11-like protein n=1 Tax=Dinothrombium tinctorium TaxID=1965070 RepID=A0A443R1Z9_9ACAR|nr:tuftelin-interacting protein 11-like protein [Dinothrombium tinctorium]RWS09313.1 tuftelin-interacting protein 11-like protein [Dinothrombium tinctorium]